MPLPCYVLLNCFSPVQLFTTPWTVAHQAPLSISFSRQDYWSGSPCPPPGDLPDPGIELASLVSPALAGVLYHWCHLGSHNSFGFHSLDCCLWPSLFLFFFFLIYLFLAVLGLPCWARVFSGCGKQGYCSHCAWASYCSAFLVIMRGLSCPMACEIFLDQGLNPCSLH